MNLILQAMKSLFRKLENRIITNVTTLAAMAQEISAVKLSTDKTKAMVDNKMDARNPVGTGSFSMNRKAGTTLGVDSHAEGNNTTASGNYSHAEGINTTASGVNSHAEGYNTTASDDGSHAEGHYTTASGNYSHAEGERTTASGMDSHAEGYKTTASNHGSHAEGNNTTASGDYSHAEGERTTASGMDSHAEGYKTTAQRAFQHTQGAFNILDTVGSPTTRGKYVHIVGNGTSETNRSNAHTLDWDGVPWYQGRPQFGGNSQNNGSQTVMANGDKELIITSSTEGSTKQFKITVDDAGTITATEVTE